MSGAVRLRVLGAELVGKVSTAEAAGSQQLGPSCVSGARARCRRRVPGRAAGLLVLVPPKSPRRPQEPASGLRGEFNRW
ncbi:hypothetical protein NDU88_008469 [Pleurodeles waltl]|uniref:Uncharacterized protein n=1 Tax=Pleurodeles waltl TaxID=8319 RepID=A0AAV7NZC4_PLEWA|nr:hypothetical protein NDU88_008469 [Pleurodeles waltl]